MFFGFATPFFFILPLIFFVVVARIAAGFFRGISRRSDQKVFDRYGVPELDPNRTRSIGRSRNSDESRIFRLALKQKGRLTVSDVVIETGLNLKEAEDLIESMVDNVHVRMELDEQGRVTYEFPEIIRRLEEGK